MYQSLFSPAGVVVIGASQNPAKLGYGVARNLVVSGFGGAIHFVNPHGGELFGRPVHRQVSQVPDPADLAVLIIPAPAVPQALEECGKRGIQIAIIASGGFSETGPEGEALEHTCLEIGRGHRMRLLGPNCIGYLDTHLPIDTTFLPLPGPIPGDIAFLSHSGAICEAVIDWARGQGFGLSRLISLGNQLDLTESDLLPATAEDPNTRVVSMYLEGIRNGRAFIEQARQVTPRKPVIAIKIGRSEAGRAAVASHTGAMAGEEKAYQAAFRKAGVIRADSSEEMFDWARALAWCPLPAGRRTAVLTNAGGPGAIAVDALAAQGLPLAELAESTLTRLGQLLPPAASLHNPVDMLASAGPGEYASCLGALLADPSVDAVMVILPPPPMTTAAEVAGALLPAIKAAEKPVVIALMGEELIAHAAQLFRGARIPDYRFPERAASALAVLVERAEWLRRPIESLPELTGIDGQKAARLLKVEGPQSPQLIDPVRAAEVLASYGVPIAPQLPAFSPEEAVAAADKLGYPVAMKAAGGSISHKSDLGGVLLNLKDGTEVRNAFRQVTDRAAAYGGQGVHLQPMVHGGQEVIIGMVRDAQFGPLVMFGSGGVEVEGLKDVAFALAPLSRSEIASMLEATWAGRRLSGYRSLPPADREAVIEALSRLGQLGLDRPEIAEVEINPLCVLEPGQGVVAIDVRIRLEAPAT
jgi:acetyl coenzyme A synthetase (ADP forming)-like protein